MHDKYLKEIEYHLDYLKKKDKKKYRSAEKELKKLSNKTDKLYRKSFKKVS